MARYDWTHAFTVAAALALAVGGISILLFATRARHYLDRVKTRLPRHAAAPRVPDSINCASIKLNNEVSLQCRGERLVIELPDEPPCPDPGKAVKQTLPSLGGFALPCRSPAGGK